MSDGMAGAWLRSHPNSEQTNLADPTDATAQTVRYMCRLVQHSLSDPVVWAATNSALKLFAIAGSPCAAIWQWCKRSIKFVHHQDLLERWLGKGDELQLLISPEALLKMERPKGDCAVFTTLICAMLQIGWVQVGDRYGSGGPAAAGHLLARLPTRDPPGRPAAGARRIAWEVPRLAGAGGAPDGNAGVGHERRAGCRSGIRLQWTAWLWRRSTNGHGMLRR